MNFGYVLLKVIELYPFSNAVHSAVCVVRIMAQEKKRKKSRREL